MSKSDKKCIRKRRYYNHLMDNTLKGIWNSNNPKKWQHFAKKLCKSILKNFKGAFANYVRTK